MQTALLDRRVAFKENAETVVRPLSYLRKKPYVVLLGEPGAGKSTSLQFEAAAEGGELITCRDVMNGASLAGLGAAYFDALDEYRLDGSGKDKILQLANAISSNSIRRWRLTCRAEDWRDVADVTVMKRAANNEPIIVARLLPLDEQEAQSLLDAFGAADSEKFIEEARRRGASAFLENPLSLKLLHSAVESDGIWPTTRFELFERAISALGHEHDPERATDPRPSSDTIIEAASTMCFYVLASGAKAIWRSNTMPQGTMKNDYVSIHDIGLEPHIARSALDTALFRGEGHAFLFFHKTVAEFLAARFLATRVVGVTTASAFPLRRATALITGNDHKAPSELRGLYAWFAAHLQNLGDPVGAQRLIKRDAATVLAYGDGAMFDTAGRREILLNLDQEDPYFLTSQDDATVFGGLAGDDLAGDFIAILDAEVRSHLQVTILQALADGPPVSRIQEKLHEITLATNRPLWMRKRTAEVLIKKAPDRMAEQLALLQSLNAMAVDRNQVAMRVLIMGGMPTDTIQVQEFRQLLSDFNILSARSTDEDDYEVGGLTPLSIALRHSPRPDFFDEPISLEGSNHQWTSEVQSLLGQALVSAIDANPNTEANRLCGWVNSIRDHPWDMLDSNVVEAIQRWIDYDTDRRELEFFLVLVGDSSPNDGPWMVSNQYASTTRRLPSEAIINGLIDLARKKKRVRERNRFFKISAYAARNATNWPVWQDKIVSMLEQERGFKGFIKSLVSDPNTRWKKKEEKRKAQENEKTEAARRENVAALTPKLHAIAGGTETVIGTLIWASEHYRNAILSEKKAPLENLIKYTNHEVTASITEGLIQFAIRGSVKFSAEEFGKFEAQNQSYRVEQVVAAGLHQALLHRRENDLAICPLIVALVGLRQSYFSGGKDPSIAAWAVRRLAQNPDQGADTLLRYWNAALDAGDEDLDAFYHLKDADEPELLSKCLKKLLNARPNLPEPALKEALGACATVLIFNEIMNLVKRTVDRNGLDKTHRDVWNFVALALMPTDFATLLSEDELRAALLAPSGELVEAYGEICPQPDAMDRIRISVLGKSCPADENDWWHSNSVSGIIRASIQRLSASKDPNAGDCLKSFVPQIHQSWQPHLLHAAAEHSRKIRDEFYVAPSVEQLKRTLADGPPASPSDLSAIVLEEIERYKSSLRTGTEKPWKRFWNTDRYGAAINPQVENEDRDRLLELFQPRFERYGIAASLPEAKRGEDSRADVLLISHAGKNLPIEAKRHYNNELWTAPCDQLAGYASDEGAYGYGIYLVFWFGTEPKFSTPAREDGSESPKSAKELEVVLTNDLPAAMKDKLTVVVLDVSRPKSMSAAVDKRRKKPKQHQ